LLIERITDVIGGAPEGAGRGPRPRGGVGCGAMGEAASDPSEIELRFALVRRRYGDRLSPEQLDEVRRAVGAIVEMVTALRTVRLTNADEPGHRFVPFRAE
jgi:hypothetical protein